MNARWELVSSSTRTGGGPGGRNAAAGSGRRWSSRSAVGQRLPARAPRLNAIVDAGRAQDRGREGCRRRLAGRAGDADGRPVPAFEQQVAEARDARPLRAQALAPAARPRASRRRGRRRRPGPDRRRDRRAARPGSRARATRLHARRAASGLARRTVAPLAGEEAGEGDRVGVEPLDEDRHVTIIPVPPVASWT